MVVDVLVVDAPVDLQGHDQHPGLLFRQEARSCLLPLSASPPTPVILVQLLLKQATEHGVEVALGQPVAELWKRQLATASSANEP